jgi:hypothetical protein
LSQLVGKFLPILKNQFEEKQMKKIYTNEQIVGFIREAEKTGSSALLVQLFSVSW